MVRKGADNVRSHSDNQPVFDSLNPISSTMIINLHAVTSKRHFYKDVAVLNPSEISQITTVSHLCAKADATFFQTVDQFKSACSCKVLMV